MDENVIAAMALWPDVPDVFGWLSLTERGHGRLHPQGDALLPVGVAGNGCSPGQAITSPPILHFIDRNYAADTHGRWYFQNGPQRVYVRLDAAPYILHTSGHADRSEEHTSELQSLMRLSYAVFCLKKKNEAITRRKTAARPRTQKNRRTNDRSPSTKAT